MKELISKHFTSVKELIEWSANTFEKVIFKLSNVIHHKLLMLWIFSITKILLKGVYTFMWIPEKKCSTFLESIIFTHFIKMLVHIFENQDWFLILLRSKLSWFIKMDIGIYQTTRKTIAFYGAMTVDISGFYQKVSFDFLVLKRGCPMWIIYRDQSPAVKHWMGRSFRWRKSLVTQSNNQNFQQPRRVLRIWKSEFKSKWLNGGSHD